MRAELILTTLKALYPIRRAVCIEGPPGVGKTSLVRQVTEEMGIEYIHLHPPTMLVEDFGMPMMTTSDVQFGYKMPHWWPVDPDTKAILCVDDRNQCGADIQKVLANMTQERELHGHYLPEGIMIVSTGNRQADRAGANRVLTHLRNRETVLELDPMLDDWCRFAIDHGVQPSVISFLRFRSNLLNDFDPQRDQNPTPRSWVEGVSAVLGVVPPEAEYECFKGAVGEGAAAEFVGFLKIERSLPDIDGLLRDPQRGDVPTDPATLYALSGGLAHRATKENFAKVIEYCARMPPEFGVLTVTFAARRDPTLATTPAFSAWAMANHDIIF